jgi:outer membrane autotransporter protein
VLIDLQGNNPTSHDDGIFRREDAYILGDIDIGPDDSIEVTNGKTFLDGIINPDEEFEGDLSIFDDGTLILLNREFGPSAAFVDTFTVESDGTLGAEFTPDTTPGEYPQVHANDASLDGTFYAIYRPGLYGDAFTYQDVIDTPSAANLTGNFATVRDNSALLVTEAVDDGTGNIDIVVTRQGFGALAGQTHNQQSLGNAIEDIFGDIDPLSNFGLLVGNLFTLNEDELADQFDSLAGAEYAQYLQSVLWSTRLLNRTITERMECDASWNAGQVASVDGMKIKPVADVLQPGGCFDPGHAHLWGSISGSWNNHDGDEEASGYDETQYAFHVGVDYAFTEEFYAGIAAGYLNSSMDFDRFGNKIDYEGLQAAAYAGFDTTVWYIRGIVSGGWYDGDSHRNIITGAGLIDPSGDPDSSVLSFYGETGYRFAIGAGTALTPYLGLTVAHAELDGTTEKDPDDTGGRLRVHSSDGDSLESTVGLRLGGDWGMGDGMFHPVLSVAWLHEFDDTRQEVDVSFADGPSGADFTVVSARTSRDSIRVGAGGMFQATDAIELGLKYDGLFNSDYESHSVIGTVRVKF